MGGDLPVVVGLGPVDPALVSGVLAGHGRFVADPGEADLAVAAGAIARAGVGVDLVDLPAATARGIAVVITPGAGTAAVAEGAIGMALHLVKRFGPLTALVREGRWAERAAVPAGDLDGAVLGVVGYGRCCASLGELGGLDVFDPEPPAPHPLYQHPDVVLTPHLMGLSRRATAATFTAAAQGVRRPTRPWTAWSTRPGSPPGARCSTPHRNCSARTSR